MLPEYVSDYSIIVWSSPQGFGVAHSLGYKAENRH
jgi:hypothetical protein